MSVRQNIEKEPVVDVVLGCSWVELELRPVNQPPRPCRPGKYPGKNVGGRGAKPLRAAAHAAVYVFVALLIVRVREENILLLAG